MPGFELSLSHLLVVAFGVSCFKLQPQSPETISYTARLAQGEAGVVQNKRQV
jgi:hypothetical protein